MNLIQDMDIDNKRVILRCDFNVPIKDNKILDDYKIRESLQTIKYIMDHNSSVIILSHLGKIKKEEDKLKNSLEIVAIRLQELLSSNVKFSKQTRSTALDELVNTLKPRDVLLLENTRFEDLPNKLESGCDAQLSSYWAELGDVFIMDAFGSSHRRHASTYGISKYLPTGIGFLIQKELKALNDYVLNPDHPFTIMMGGAKIDDKLDLMNKLLPKCDKMLLSGGLANTCLKVLGFNVGNSIVSDNSEILNKVKEMLVTYKDKISLPYDVIVTNTYDDTFIDQKGIEEVDSNEEIKDIGGKTIDEYKKIINNSKTIFVNGTCGIYEDIKFANGTKEILRILAESNANVIVGGGDGASAARNFGYANSFAYVSTGGGATLEYIINEKLAALEDIEETEVL
ncbi:MAG: phosphoglycerate kinase [Bacilli bacterium]|nr:phosphoglycerate kinase [Bacilli bacterium]